MTNFVEVHPTEGERFWDLSAKSPEELEVLKRELLPELQQIVKFPDGKFYRYQKGDRPNQ